MFRNLRRLRLTNYEGGARLHLEKHLCERKEAGEKNPQIYQRERDLYYWYHNTCHGKDAQEETNVSPCQHDLFRICRPLALAGSP